MMFMSEFSRCIRCFSNSFTAVEGTSGIFLFLLKMTTGVLESNFISP